jgi:hypothetical protein
MNLYVIHADQDGVRLGTRYAGSMLEARRTRDELCEQHNVNKKFVTVDEEEFPTKKGDLIQALNDLCSMADTKESET